MASNPTVGVVSDLVVDAGGTTILSETTELMGEHVLARRARNEEVARRIFEIVANVERAANAVGATVAGGSPPRATWPGA